MKDHDNSKSMNEDYSHMNSYLQPSLVDPFPNGEETSVYSLERELEKT